MTASSQRSVTRRDLTVAAACGVFVAVMVGASYAAVPLYDWFCRTTGFGGRTQVATAAPSGTLGREVTVRFDSNIAAGLPWRFEPEQNEIKARLGEVVTVNYKVRNLTARETAGQASYNVSPPQAGYYFHKINCFCFTEQEMKPGEARDMAVVFYVDPALAKDADQAKLDTITLSYTFYSMPTKQAEIPPKASGKL